MKSSLKSIAAFLAILGTFATGADGRNVADSQGSPRKKSLSANANVEIAQANNRFAVDLYGRLTKEQPGKNLFFSPASISIALAMTAAGAQGRTEAEMEEMLHLTGHMPKAQSEYREALAQWNRDDKDQGYTLRVADRLWGQKDLAFLPDYLSLTRQQFGAELGLVDFAGQTDAARREINEWVAKQTADRVPELIGKSDLDARTRLVLANAVYFKGKWAAKFAKNATRDEDFAISSSEAAMVPLMQNLHSYPYAETETLQALELPYQGNDLSMLVLLPKSADGLPELESSLTASEIADLQRRLRASPVRVFLPKFRMDASFSMEETLESLGMKAAFTDAADFSGMDGRRDLRISAVIHKAFVDVDEEGTEAAAATGVVMRIKSAPVAKKPAVFRADHPFVFMITDKRDGGILFLGRVTDPR